MAWVAIAMFDVTVDCGEEFGPAGNGASARAVLGDVAEEALDRVQPRREVGVICMSTRGCLASHTCARSCLWVRVNRNAVVVASIEGHEIARACAGARARLEEVLLVVGCLGDPSRDLEAVRRRDCDGVAKLPWRLRPGD